MAEKEKEKQVVVSPEKEGWLKKRGGRMHRWTSRYFALCGSTLVYKLKKDSPAARGSYDLEAGCLLTEVEDEAKHGKKHLYSFWVVWPQLSAEEDKKLAVEEQPLSDDEEETVANKSQKDLKQIVRSEVITNRTKQKKAEEALEKHHNVDNNLSMGMKVAAVAVGGVVIGTLTLGIGLIPYMTVVGITAVASGAGVAYQYRRPSDSRLILATESLSEALAWKAAIEDQIVKLEITKCPRLPIAADPSVIASILGISNTGGGWFKVAHKEGVRIMEQKDSNSQSQHSSSDVAATNGSLMSLDSVFDIFRPVSISSLRKDRENKAQQNEISNKTGVVCRKAQTIIPSSAVNVFLALMNTSDGAQFWPRGEGSTLKVVHTADDHADIIGVSAPLDRSGEFYNLSYYDRVIGKVLDDIRMEGCLSRFWKLDDDGTYVIFYNSTTEGDSLFNEATEKPYKSLPLKMDAVLSVAPRKDLINQEHICQMDMDANECQVTISIQLQLNDSVTDPSDVEKVATPSPWHGISDCTRNSFMNAFVEQILDLRENFYLNRFDFDFDNEVHSNNSNHKSYPDDGRAKGNKSGIVGPSLDGGGKPSRVSHAITTQPTQEVSTKARRKSGSGMTARKATSSPSQSRSRSPAVSKTVEKGDAPPAMTKARSQKLANEAAHLRNHIASKEYELARLNKAMTKRKDSAGTLGSHTSPPSKRAISPPAPSTLNLPAVQHNKISSKPSPAVVHRSDSPVTRTGGSTKTSATLKQEQEQEQLTQHMTRTNELNNELEELKEKYFQLTGNFYDRQHSRRHSTRRSSKTGSDLKSKVVDEISVSNTESPAPMIVNKTRVAAHIPMTPAAKSIRFIQDESPVKKDKSPISNISIPKPEASKPLNISHPPHWTIISSENMRKQCVECTLQPFQRDILFYFLYFTVALVCGIFARDFY